MCMHAMDTFVRNSQQFSVPNCCLHALPHFQVLCGFMRIGAYIIPQSIHSWKCSSNNIILLAHTQYLHSVSSLEGPAKGGSCPPSPCVVLIGNL